MTADDVVAELRPGMTIGIGGWGARRKPMALVRAIARSDLSDLTIVSFGGPDVGLLCATGHATRLVYGFVSLEVSPLEPHFRAARQAGAVTATELDEGMLYWGLYAASLRLPFLPTRAGLGADVVARNPAIRTVANPYDPDEVLVAMPALHLDAALVHAHRATARGDAAILSPDPFFDDLFCGAAERAYVSCDELVDTEALGDGAPTLRLSRAVVAGVVHAPRGAHPTACDPAYPRDDAALRAYAEAATADDPRAAVLAGHLGRSEDAYRAAFGGAP